MSRFAFLEIRRAWHQQRVALGRCRQCGVRVTRFQRCTICRAKEAARPRVRRRAS